MIEKMKKLTFLVTNREYEDFLIHLRELGVVHIQQLQEGVSSPQLQTALDEQTRYEQALQALETASKTYKLEEVPTEDIYRTSPAVLLKHLEELQAEDLRIQRLFMTRTAVHSHQFPLDLRPAPMESIT